MEEVELIISVNQKQFFDSKNPEISTVSLVVNEENEPALKLSLDKEVINRNYEEETENNLSEVKKFIEESFHKSGMANIFEKVDPESLKEIVNYIYNLEDIEAVKIASRYNDYGYLENVFNRDKLEELGFAEKDFEGKSSSEKIQLVYDRFGIDGVQRSLSRHSLERSLEYLILKQDIDIANSAVPEIELQKLYEEGGLKRTSEILGENVDEYYYSNGIKGLQDYYEGGYREDRGKITGYEEYISSFRQYLSIRDIGSYSIDGKEITISLPKDRDQALETLYKLFNVSRYPVSLENPNLKKFNKPIIENYHATERAIRNHYDKINEKPKILSDRVEVYENGTALIRAVPESVHDDQVSGPEGAAAADVQIYSVFIYPSSQEDVNDLYEAVVKAVLRAERYNDPLKGELYIDYFENRVYLPPHGFFKEYNNRFSEPAVQIHNGAVVIREMNLDDLRSFYNEMKDYVEPSFEIAQDIQKAIKGEYRGPIKRLQGYNRFGVNKDEYVYKETENTPSGYGNLYNIEPENLTSATIEELRKLWLNGDIDDSAFQMHLLQTASKIIEGELPDPTGRFKALSSGENLDTDKDLVSQREKEVVQKILLAVTGIKPDSSLSIDQQLKEMREAFQEAKSSSEEKRKQEIEKNLRESYQDRQSRVADSMDGLEQIYREQRKLENKQKDVKTKGLINYPQLPSNQFFDNRGKGNDQVPHLARSFEDTPYTSRSPGDLLTRYNLSDFDPNLQALYDEQMNKNKNKPHQLNEQAKNMENENNNALGNPIDNAKKLLEMLKNLVELRGEDKSLVNKIESFVKQNSDNIDFSYINEDDDRNFLHYAAETNLVFLANRILSDEKYKDLINKGEEDDLKPLQFTVVEDTLNFEVAKLLLENGADIGDVINDGFIPEVVKKRLQETANKIKNKIEDDLYNKESKIDEYTRNRKIEKDPYGLDVEDTIYTDDDPDTKAQDQEEDIYKTISIPKTVEDLAEQIERGKKNLLGENSTNKGYGGGDLVAEGIIEGIIQKSFNQNLGVEPINVIIDYFQSHNEYNINIPAIFEHSILINTRYDEGRLSSDKALGYTLKSLEKIFNINKDNEFESLYLEPRNKSKDMFGLILSIAESKDVSDEERAEIIKSLNNTFRLYEYLGFEDMEQKDIDNYLRDPIKTLTVEKNNSATLKVLHEALYIHRNYMTEGQQTLVERLKKSDNDINSFFYDLEKNSALQTIILNLKTTEDFRELVQDFNTDLNYVNASGESVFNTMLTRPDLISIIKDLDREININAGKPPLSYFISNNNIFYNDRIHLDYSQMLSYIVNQPSFGEGEVGQEDIDYIKNNDLISELKKHYNPDILLTRNNFLKDISSEKDFEKLFSVNGRPIKHIPNKQKDPKEYMQFFNSALNATFFISKITDLPFDESVVIARKIISNTKGVWKDISREFYNMKISDINSLKDTVSEVSKYITSQYLLLNLEEEHVEKIGNLEFNKINKQVSLQLLDYLLEYKDYSALIEMSEVWHSKRIPITDHGRHQTNNNDPINSVRKNSMEGSWQSMTEKKEVQVSLEGFEDYTIINLTNSDELNAEGNELSHCVGGYTSQCLAGTSHIFSFRNSEGKALATLELDENMEYLQFRGYNDAKPEPYLQEMKDWFIKSLNSLDDEERIPTVGKENYGEIKMEDDEKLLPLENIAGYRKNEITPEDFAETIRIFTNKSPYQTNHNTVPLLQSNNGTNHLIPGKARGSSSGTDFMQLTGLREPVWSSLGQHVPTLTSVADEKLKATEPKKKKSKTDENWQTKIDNIITKFKELSDQEEYSNVKILEVKDRYVTISYIDNGEQKETKRGGFNDEEQRQYFVNNFQSSFSSLAKQNIEIDTKANADKIIYLIGDQDNYIETISDLKQKGYDIHLFNDLQTASAYAQENFKGEKSNIVDLLIVDAEKIKNGSGLVTPKYIHNHFPDIQYFVTTKDESLSEQMNQKQLYGAGVKSFHINQQGAVTSKDHFDQLLTLTIQSSDSRETKFEKILNFLNSDEGKKVAGKVSDILSKADSKAEYVSVRNISQATKNSDKILLQFKGDQHSKIILLPLEDIGFKKAKYDEAFDLVNNYIQYVSNQYNLDVVPEELVKRDNVLAFANYKMDSSNVHDRAVNLASKMKEQNNVTAFDINFKKIYHQQNAIILTFYGKTKQEFELPIDQYNDYFLLNTVDDISASLEGMFLENRSSRSKEILEEAKAISKQALTDNADNMNQQKNLHLKHVSDLSDEELIAKYSLRGSQVQMLRDVMKSYASENKSILVAATGSGKTWVTQTIWLTMNDALKGTKFEDNKFLYTTYGTSIRDQAAKELIEKRGIDESEVGILKSGLSDKELEEVLSRKYIFTNNDALEAYLENGTIKSSDFAHVLIDEAHMNLSEKTKFQIFKEHFFGNCMVLGSTATPYTAYGHLKHQWGLKEYAYFSGPAEEMARGNINLPTAVGVITLGSIPNTPERIALADINLKQRLTYKTGSGTEVQASELRTFASISTIEKGKEIAEIYNKAFGEGYAEVISSELSQEDRESMQQRFENGETKMLITAGVLKTGYDFSDIAFVLHLSDTHSIANAVQVDGRVTRYSDEYPVKFIIEHNEFPNRAAQLVLGGKNFVTNSLYYNPDIFDDLTPKFMGKDGKPVLTYNTTETIEAPNYDAYIGSSIWTLEGILPNKSFDVAQTNNVLQEKSKPVKKSGTLDEETKEIISKMQENFNLFLKTGEFEPFGNFLNELLNNGEQAEAIFANLADGIDFEQPQRDLDIFKRREAIESIISSYEKLTETIEKGKYVGLSVTSDDIKNNSESILALEFFTKFKESLEFYEKELEDTKTLNPQKEAEIFNEQITYYVRDENNVTVFNLLDIFSWGSDSVKILEAWYEGGFLNEEFVAHPGVDQKIYEFQNQFNQERFKLVKDENLEEKNKFYGKIEEDQYFHRGDARRLNGVFGEINSKIMELTRGDIDRYSEQFIEKVDQYINTDWKDSDKQIEALKEITKIYKGSVGKDFFPQDSFTAYLKSKKFNFDRYHEEIQIELSDVPNVSSEKAEDYITRNGYKLENLSHLHYQLSGSLIKVTGNKASPFRQRIGLIKHDFDEADFKFSDELTPEKLDKIFEFYIQNSNPYDPILHFRNQDVYGLYKYAKDSNSSFLRNVSFQESSKHILKGLLESEDVTPLAEAMRQISSKPWEDRKKLQEEEHEKLAQALNETLSNFFKEEGVNISFPTNKTNNYSIHLEKGPGNTYNLFLSTYGMDFAIYLAIDDNTNKIQNISCDYFAGKEMYKKPFEEHLLPFLENAAQNYEKYLDSSESYLASERTSFRDYFTRSQGKQKFELEKYLTDFRPEIDDSQLPMRLNLSTKKYSKSSQVTSAQKEGLEFDHLRYNKYLKKLSKEVYELYLIYNEIESTHKPLFRDETFFIRYANTLVKQLNYHEQAYNYLVEGLGYYDYPIDGYESKSTNDRYKISRIKNQKSVLEELTEKIKIEIFDRATTIYEDLLDIDRDTLFSLSLPELFEKYVEVVAKSYDIETSKKLEQAKEENSYLEAFLEVYHKEDMEYILKIADENPSSLPSVISGRKDQISHEKIINTDPDSYKFGTLVAKPRSSEREEFYSFGKLEPLGYSREYIAMAPIKMAPITFGTKDGQKPVGSIIFVEGHDTYYLAFTNKDHISKNQDLSESVINEISEAVTWSRNDSSEKDFQELAVKIASTNIENPLDKIFFENRSISSIIESDLISETEYKFLKQLSSLSKNLQNILPGYPNLEKFTRTVDEEILQNLENFKVIKGLGNPYELEKATYKSEIEKILTKRIREFDNSKELQGYSIEFEFKFQKNRDGLVITTIIGGNKSNARQDRISFEGDLPERERLAQIYAQIIIENYSAQSRQFEGIDSYSTEYTIELDNEEKLFERETIASYVKEYMNELIDDDASLHNSVGTSFKVRLKENSFFGDEYQIINSKTGRVIVSFNNEENIDFATQLLAQSVKAYDPKIANIVSFTSGNIPNFQDNSANQDNEYLLHYNPTLHLIKTLNHGMIKSFERSDDSKPIFSNATIYIDNIGKRLDFKLSYTTEQGEEKFIINSYYESHSLDASSVKNLILYIKDNFVKDLKEKFLGINYFGDDVTLMINGENAALTPPQSYTWDGSRHYKYNDFEAQFTRNLRKVSATLVDNQDGIKFQLSLPVVNVKLEEASAKIQQDIQNAIFRRGSEIDYERVRSAISTDPFEQYFKTYGLEASTAFILSEKPETQVIVGKPKTKSLLDIELTDRDEYIKQRMNEAILVPGDALVYIYYDKMRPGQGLIVSEDAKLASSRDSSLSLFATSNIISPYLSSDKPEDAGRYMSEIQEFLREQKEHYEKYKEDSYSLGSIYKALDNTNLTVFSAQVYNTAREKIVKAQNYKQYSKEFDVRKDDIEEKSVLNIIKEGRNDKKRYAIPLERQQDLVTKLAEAFIKTAEDGFLNIVAYSPYHSDIHLDQTGVYNPNSLRYDVGANISENKNYDGFYNPKDGFVSTDQSFSTLLHELGHVEFRHASYVLDKYYSGSDLRPAFLENNSTWSRLINRELEKFRNNEEPLLFEYHQDLAGYAESNYFSEEAYVRLITEFRQNLSRNGGDFDKTSGYMRRRYDDVWTGLLDYIYSDIKSTLDKDLILVAGALRYPNKEQGNIESNPNSSTDLRVLEGRRIYQEFLSERTKKVGDEYIIDLRHASIDLGDKIDYKNWSARVIENEFFSDRRSLHGKYTISGEMLENIKNFHLISKDDLPRHSSVSNNLDITAFQEYEIDLTEENLEALLTNIFTEGFTEIYEIGGDQARDADLYTGFVYEVLSDLPLDFVEKYDPNVIVTAIGSANSNLRSAYPKIITDPLVNLDAMKGRVNNLFSKSESQSSKGNNSSGQPNEPISDAEIVRPSRYKSGNLGFRLDFGLFGDLTSGGKAELNFTELREYITRRVRDLVSKKPNPAFEDIPLTYRDEPYNGPANDNLDLNETEGLDLNPTPNDPALDLKNLTKGLNLRPLPADASKVKADPFKKLSFEPITKLPNPYKGLPSSDNAQTLSSSISRGGYSHLFDPTNNAVTFFENGKKVVSVNLNQPNQSAKEVFGTTNKTTLAGRAMNAYYTLKYAPSEAMPDAARTEAMRVIEEAAVKGITRKGVSMSGVGLAVASASLLPRITDALVNEEDVKLHSADVLTAYFGLADPLTMQATSRLSSLLSGSSKAGLAPYVSAEAMELTKYAGGSSALNQLGASKYATFLNNIGKVVMPALIPVTGTSWVDYSEAQEHAREASQMDKVLGNLNHAIHFGTTTLYGTGMLTGSSAAISTGNIFLLAGLGFEIGLYSRQMQGLGNPDVAPSVIIDPLMKQVGSDGGIWTSGVEIKEDASGFKSLKLNPSKLSNIADNIRIPTFTGAVGSITTDKYNKETEDKFNRYYREVQERVNSDYYINQSNPIKSVQKLNGTDVISYGTIDLRDIKPENVGNRAARKKGDLRKSMDSNRADLSALVDFERLGGVLDRYIYEMNLRPENIKYYDVEVEYAGNHSSDVTIFFHSNDPFSENQEKPKAVTFKMPNPNGMYSESYYANLVQATIAKYQINAINQEIYYNAEQTLLDNSDAIDSLNPRAVQQSIIETQNNIQQLKQFVTSIDGYQENLEIALPIYEVILEKSKESLKLQKEYLFEGGLDDDIANAQEELTNIQDILNSFDPENNAQIAFYYNNILSLDLQNLQEQQQELNFDFDDISDEQLPTIMLLLRGNLSDKSLVDLGLEELPTIDNPNQEDQEKSIFDIDFNQLNDSQTHAVRNALGKILKEQRESISANISYLEAELSAISQIAEQVNANDNNWNGPLSQRQQDYLYTASFSVQLRLQEMVANKEGSLGYFTDLNKNKDANYAKYQKQIEAYEEQISRLAEQLLELQEWQNRPAPDPDEMPEYANARFSGGLKFLENEKEEQNKPLAVLRQTAKRSLESLEKHLAYLKNPESLKNTEAAILASNAKATEIRDFTAEYGDKYEFVLNPDLVKAPIVTPVSSLNLGNGSSAIKTLDLQISSLQSIQNCLGIASHNHLGEPIMPVAFQEYRQAVVSNMANNLHHLNLPEKCQAMQAILSSYDKVPSVGDSDFAVREEVINAIKKFAIDSSEQAKVEMLYALSNVVHGKQISSEADRFDLNNTPYDADLYKEIKDILGVEVLREITEEVREEHMQQKSNPDLNSPRPDLSPEKGFPMDIKDPKIFKLQELKKNQQQKISPEQKKMLEEFINSRGNETGHIQIDDPSKLSKGRLEQLDYLGINPSEGVPGEILAEWSTQELLSLIPNIEKSQRDNPDSKIKLDFSQDGLVLRLMIENDPKFAISGMAPSQVLQNMFKFSDEVIAYLDLDSEEGRAKFLEQLPQMINNPINLPAQAIEEQQTSTGFYNENNLEKLINENPELLENIMKAKETISTAGQKIYSPNVRNNIPNSDELNPQNQALEDSKDYLTLASEYGVAITSALGGLENVLEQLKEQYRSMSNAEKIGFAKRIFGGKEKNPKTNSEYLQLRNSIKSFYHTLDSILNPNADDHIGVTYKDLHDLSRNFEIMDNAFINLRKVIGGENGKKEMEYIGNLVNRIIGQFKQEEYNISPVEPNIYNVI